jgi:hypothetical protein
VAISAAGQPLEKRQKCEFSPRRLAFSCYSPSQRFACLALGEAGEAAWAFRSIYGVIGLGCLGGSVALIARWRLESRTAFLVGTALLLAAVIATFCVFGFKPS